MREEGAPIEDGEVAADAGDEEETEEVESTE